MAKRSSLYRLATKILLCAAVLQGCIFLPLQAGVKDKIYAAGQPVVATWLWNTYDIWKDKEQTLDYLEQNGVTLLYLQYCDEIPNEIYGAFIREAGAKGIEVHALGGSPDWVLPQNQGKLYQFILWVINYNYSVPPAERFNGIHLDVEPYVLPQWQSDPGRVIGYWQDTVSGFVQEVKTDSASTIGTRLTVGADLPVWLNGIDVRDGNGGKTTLSNWMMSKLDQVAFMAYIDNAEGIVKAVANELDEAENNGVSAIVGLETLNNYEANSSFYAKGRAQLMSAVDAVARDLSDKPAFAGYAFHDYESWSALKE